MKWHKKYDYGEVTLEAVGTVETKAIFSDKNRYYRYYLERNWKTPNLKTAAIIMLNPSYADEFKLDLSIMKVSNMLIDMNYCSLRVVNLFAFVATEHSALVSTIGNTGKTNDEWIIKAIKNVDLLIIAWGSDDNKYKNRKREVKEIIMKLPLKDKPKKIQCFIDEENRKGRHPSRLGELKLVDYS
ncbi:DUF1643 domain-containing protein [Paenibacillus azoreducens]|uniref:DUF1643 domain-containing protein n=1 Tax=Paenibacillus azoreducens TaxID=116718 RepID=A0A920CUH8_9BACL|nr:DUF1643 domain-containing protein [Paenibacillus azoreducens]GIO49452.1 hypothetical protein J34TS1_42170 [Paenibacillus azoreducens]